MPRPVRKGYFVRGQFVAEGSELDLELQRDRQDAGPSKTERKAESAELQTLGEQLAGLRAGALDALNLPARLTEALAELARITDFGAQRRQRQFIGKLMRQLGEADLATIRAALQDQRQGAARETLLLHAAEDWRERLIAHEDALTEWLAQHPGAGAQQLRALIRQARKDRAAPDAAPGQAQRQGRAARQLFQLLREGLAALPQSGDEPSANA
jgi:ribosome-associated protein